jgi:hypothetical protein
MGKQTRAARVIRAPGYVFACRSESAIHREAAALQITPRAMSAIF